MHKKFDAIALGELLIDFTEAGISENGNRLFEQNPGGAPANLLTAVSHMGYKTAFIGKVGKDMHGDFLKETIVKEGINADWLIQDEKVFTTLAFVAINNGERSFSFARKPGADTCLSIDDIDFDVIKDCRIFHIGSLSLTDEPSRSATYAAVKAAKEAGAIISYDPNYRASLWKSEEEAVKNMLEMMPYADMVKVSDEESLLITGEKEYIDAAHKILGMGAKVVAVTLGKDGGIVVCKDGYESIKGFEVNAIDTTGAGDTFWGGFLSEFLNTGKEIENLTKEELRKCAVTGNAAAALCVQKRGGIPSVPSKEELDVFLRNR